VPKTVTGDPDGEDPRSTRFGQTLHDNAGIRRRVRLPAPLASVATERSIGRLPHCADHTDKLLDSLASIHPVDPVDRIDQV